MATLKQNLEELNGALKEWQKSLSGTDSEKAKEVGKSIARFADYSWWNDKILQPLKKLTLMQRNDLGMFE